MFISTKLSSIHTFSTILFILLSSLLVSEKAFAQKYWNKEFTKVTYDPSENSISIKFEVFDYYFGPTYENAYLERCDFYFTTNDKNYHRLMRSESSNQRVRDYTKFKMKCKYIGTDLQFLGCFNPENEIMWPDNILTVNVKVKNDVKGHISFEKNNKKIKVDKYIAFFTVKWFLGKKFMNVKRILLNGRWKVNGFKHDEIVDVYYDIPNRKLLNSTVNQSEDNRMKVACKGDAIVISGAENGQNIKVHNATGVEVRSTVTNGDVVNIKLPKNQIYIVNIGQSRHKVAI